MLSNCACCYCSSWMIGINLAWIVAPMENLWIHFSNINWSNPCETGCTNANVIFLHFIRLQASGNISRIKSLFNLSSQPSNSTHAGIVNGVNQQKTAFKSLINLREKTIHFTLEFVTNLWTALLALVDQFHNWRMNANRTHSGKYEWNQVFAQLCHRMSFSFICWDLSVFPWHQTRLSIGYNHSINSKAFRNRKTFNFIQIWCDSS